MDSGRGMRQTAYRFRYRPHRSRGSAVSPPPPHVVVLEDSPALAQSLGAVFTEAHYRVTALTDCAVDPADLLVLAPDLILLDLQGGYGWQGLDLLRRLRADPAGRDVPVIASPKISWFASRVRIPELDALGAVVLPDPFTVDAMLAAARGALAQSREVRRRSDAALDRLRAVREKSPPE